MSSVTFAERLVGFNDAARKANLKINRPHAVNSVVQLIQQDNQCAAKHRQQEQKEASYIETASSHNAQYIFLSPGCFTLRHQFRTQLA